MQLKYSDMPDLDAAIKKQVNLGNVALYFQKSGVNGDTNIKYVLRIMNNVNYMLTQTGQIHSVTPSDNYDKSELVLFVEG